jgi:hypothetical protein
MAEFNPYAPPQSPVSAVPGEGYWRDGKVLVMRIGADLPHRCVRCNEPALEPIARRSMSWHHPAWFVLFFLSILALIIRRSAKVPVPLCAQHQRRRVISLAVAWVGSIVGALIMFAAAVNDSGGLLIAAGLVLLLLGIGAGLVGARSIYPARITKEEVRLSGCGAAFLDSIPAGGPAAG